LNQLVLLKRGAVSMPQEFDSPNQSQNPVRANSSEQDAAEAAESLQLIVEMVAAGLYSLASMLVGEGADSEQLVETAIANAEISVCQNPQEAILSSQRALSAAALDLLAKRDPDSFAPPEGLTPSSICIDDDDLASAGISRDELKSMISGSERDRVREWLASLPTAMRTIFILRAVAGFSAVEASQLLKTHGGPQATDWSPETTREVFRQGLCSLASQLLHASAER
jgi:DNA-directed RNA polymerase specialized sigma24 family protein